VYSTAESSFLAAVDQGTVENRHRG